MRGMEKYTRKDYRTSENIYQNLNLTHLKENSILKIEIDTIAPN
jgi:hypothetical protein